MFNLRIAAATSLLAFPLLALAAPFSNGDFESTGIPPGTFVSLSGGASPPPAGWMVGGNITPFAEFLENGVFGVVGISGPNVVGFGGGGTSGASLYQVFDTLPGQSYRVDFFVTSQQGNSPMPQSVDLQVFSSVDGTSLFTPTGLNTTLIPGYDSSAESFHWAPGNSLLFVAPTAFSMIRFMDTTPDSSASNWALDGVTVSLVSPVLEDVVVERVSAVPEPESLASMLGGLVVLATIVRRRKRAI